MPTKNTLKVYLENSYYHIYNRGIDKREIFLDEKDCVQFLHYLKLYLSSPEYLLQEKEITPQRLYKINNTNISTELELLSFSLMPNHFHMQVKQSTPYGIEKLARRLLSSYSRYFNTKYKRKGTLFESSYKAVLLSTTEQYLYLSSYIHRNPLKLKRPKFDFVQFSSYPYYLGQKRAVWIKPEEILTYFDSKKKGEAYSYKSFVEDFREEPVEILNDLIIEDA